MKERKIFRGTLSCGGYIGPKIILMEGQTAVFEDTNYRGVFLEVRAGKVIDGSLTISCRFPYERRYKRANTLHETLVKYGA